MLTLYLGSREITCRAGVVDPIKGVVYIDPRIHETNQKVYCQVTLTFRWEFFFFSLKWKIDEMTLRWWERGSVNVHCCYRMLCFSYTHKRKNELYTSQWQSIFDISSPPLPPSYRLSRFHQISFNFQQNKPTITFSLHNISIKRYGREDEEVMGLKFCNEAIIAFHQIWPKVESEQKNFKLTPLQVFSRASKSFTEWSGVDKIFKLKMYVFVFVPSSCCPPAMIRTNRKPSWSDWATIQHHF